MKTPIVVHGNIINRERAQFSDATQSAAVRELVDNSVDANATLIELQFDATARTITISDDGDGCSDLSRFFNLGDSSKTSEVSGNIGRYGIGGTWAAMYLSDVQEVVTVRRGEGVMRKAVMHWTAAADESEAFAFETVYERPVTRRDMQHGTRIRLSGVRNGNADSTNIFRPASRRSLRETLGKTYGAAIARSGLCIGLDDEPIEASAPPDQAACSADLMLDVVWRGRRLRIHARHMANEDAWKPGVYVAYRGRLLNRNARPWDAWTKGSPVWVWVDLWDDTERWHLSWSKDDFADRVELLDDVMATAEVAAFMHAVDMKTQNMDSMLLGEELSSDLSAVLAPMTRILEKRPGQGGETGTVIPIHTGIERRHASVVDPCKPGTIDESKLQQKPRMPYRIVLRDLGPRGPVYSVSLDVRERKRHNQLVEASFGATVTLNINDPSQRERLRDKSSTFVFVTQAVMLKMAREEPHKFDAIYFHEMGEPVGDMVTKDEYALRLAHVLMLRSQAIAAPKKKPRASR